MTPLVFEVPPDASIHAVADMMASPRTSVKYSNICPSDEGW